MSDPAAGKRGSKRAIGTENNVDESASSQPSSLVTRIETLTDYLLKRLNTSRIGLTSHFLSSDCASSCINLPDISDLTSTSTSRRKNSNPLQIISTDDSGNGEEDSVLIIDESPSPPSIPPERLNSPEMIDKLLEPLKKQANPITAEEFMDCNSSRSMITTRTPRPRQPAGRQLSRRRNLSQYPMQDWMLDENSSDSSSSPKRTKTSSSDSTEEMPDSTQMAPPHDASLLECPCRVCVSIRAAPTNFHMLIPTVTPPSPRIDVVSESPSPDSSGVHVRRVSSNAATRLATYRKPPVASTTATTSSVVATGPLLASTSSVVRLLASSEPQQFITTRAAAAPPPSRLVSSTTQMPMAWVCDGNRVATVPGNAIVPWSPINCTNALIQMRQIYDNQCYGGKRVWHYPFAPHDTDDFVTTVPMYVPLEECCMLIARLRQHQTTGRYNTRPHPDFVHSKYAEIRASDIPHFHRMQRPTMELDLLQIIRQSNQPVQMMLPVRIIRTLGILAGLNFEPPPPGVAPTVDVADEPLLWKAPLSTNAGLLAKISKMAARGQPRQRPLPITIVREDMKKDIKSLWEAERPFPHRKLEYHQLPLFHAHILAAVLTYGPVPQHVAVAVNIPINQATWYMAALHISAFTHNEMTLATMAPTIIAVLLSARHESWEQIANTVSNMVQAPFLVPALFPYADAIRAYMLTVVPLDYRTAVTRAAGINFIKYSPRHWWITWVPQSMLKEFEPMYSHFHIRQGRVDHAASARARTIATAIAFSSFALYQHIAHTIRVVVRESFMLTHGDTLHRRQLAPAFFFQQPGSEAVQEDMQGITPNPCKYVELLDPEHFLNKTVRDNMPAACQRSDCGTNRVSDVCNLAWGFWGQISDNPRCEHDAVISAEKFGPAKPEWWPSIYSELRTTTNTSWCLEGEPRTTHSTGKAPPPIGSRQSGHLYRMLVFDARDAVRDVAPLVGNIVESFNNLSYVYDDESTYKLFLPETRKAMLQAEYYCRLAMQNGGNITIAQWTTLINARFPMTQTQAALNHLEKQLHHHGNKQPYRRDQPFGSSLNNKIMIEDCDWSMPLPFYG